MWIALIVRVFQCKWTTVSNNLEISFESCTYFIYSLDFGDCFYFGLLGLALTETGGFKTFLAKISKMGTTETTPPISASKKLDLHLLDMEKTPLGPQNNSETKIQLCIEIREKELKRRRRPSAGTKPEKELVLEVTVMYLKNLFRTSEPTPGSTPVQKRKLQDAKRPTFVKIQVTPGNVIYSTELKMDKFNREKVDLNFIEVFAFPLESLDDLKDKKLEVQVCDKKMTRNATTFGQVVIDLGEYKLGKPDCKWFVLNNSSQQLDSVLAKP